MLQAFDTIMRCAVTALEVSKNNIDEPFRYECLCCGEEVHIAAANSTKKSPHFRHLRGNSDRDCELYLGSMGIEGALIAAKRRTHERAEIFYDTIQKIFSISISFPQEKIEEYERKGCTLEIYSGQNKSKKESIRIARTNFSPDSPVVFPLNYSRNGCFIEINGDGIKAHYDILKPIDFPTFFKMKASSNMEKAKRHTDGIIYIGYPYYIIAEKRSSIEKLYNYGSGVHIREVDEIPTMEGSIWGAYMVITSPQDHLANILTIYGYTLKNPDYAIVLWPPSFTTDDTLCCSSTKVVIRASFELKAKGNISCDPQDLEYKESHYSLKLSEPVSIRYENIDMQLLPIRNDNLSDEIPMPSTIQALFVETTESGEYYLIDHNGITNISNGRFYLRENTKIICYKNNYPSVVYVPLERHDLSSVGKLRDILQYYYVTIPFTDDLIAGLQVSKLAETYLEDCRITGKINCRALDYIKAGII